MLGLDMGMYETIKKTAGQFAFKPKIINGRGLEKYSKYVVVGMGGSHLAVGLLKLWKPELDIISHQDYGLPELPKMELKKRLIILWVKSNGRKQHNIWI